MNLTLDTRLQPNPDVIVTELTDADGAPQAVLLDLSSHQYFSLNATGIDIWKAVSQGAPLASAMTDLTARYEVSPDQATAAVLRLAADLASANLAILLDETSPGGGHAGGTDRYP